MSNAGLYPGGGTETPILGLPDDTFSEEDRETADRWSDEVYPAWDLSESPHVGGTRSDRRGALVDTVDDVMNVVPTDKIQLLLLLAVAAVLAYAFGQLFDIQLGGG